MPIQGIQSRGPHYDLSTKGAFSNRHILQAQTSEAWIIYDCFKNQ